MTFQPVDVRIVDTTTDHAPIKDVVVKVLSQDGRTAYAQLQTDETGTVQALLAPGVYQLRFFKAQVNLRACLIEVPDVPSVFTILGELFNPPTVMDARLCVAYGYFRDVTGAPASNVEIILIAKFNPLWLEGKSVMTERRTVRTDEKGYIETSLIRFGQYDVTVSGFEDQTRTIYVPDALNVNINDLLFPVVEKVVFEPPGPFSVRVGPENDYTVIPAVYASDGRLLEGTATGDVRWESSDPTVLAVLVTPTTLVLRGLSPGTAEVRVVRWDTSIIHIPDPGIEGQPVLVTVVP